LATGTPAQADAILTFWFRDCRPIQWFRGGPGMDHAIRDRFGETVQQAIDGDCQHWHRHPQTALALVLLLDQFQGTSGAARPLPTQEISRPWNSACLPKRRAGYSRKHSVPGVSSG